MRKLNPFSLLLQFRSSFARAGKNHRGSKRLIRFAPVVILVGALSYLALFGVQVVKGLSQTVEEPVGIRLELLSGSDVLRAHEIKRLAGCLEKSGYGGVKISVVERRLISSRSNLQSLVISRRPDLKSARHFAVLIGLSPGSVVYRPLEFNRNMVTVSLIVGDDIDIERLCARPLSES